MTDSESTPPPRFVALFDLDGTLTWRDTLLPFLLMFLRQHPWRWLRLWRLPSALLGYLTGKHDRGLLKSRVIRMVMGGAGRPTVDSCAEMFVSSLGPRHRLRPTALGVLDAHRTAGDHLVLLSASPDLYVPRIGRALGFELTLCTEIEWQGEQLLGELRTPNRHGPEKSRCLAWLRRQYPGMPVIAYGNSASDLDHMRQADRALLVNGSTAARRAAASFGIATATWT